MVSQLSHVLLSSFEIMKKELYISEFAQKEVKALGLLPPPMLWIFEWDIVTAGDSVLSCIYNISGDKTDVMVQAHTYFCRLNHSSYTGASAHINRNCQPHGHPGEVPDGR